MRESKATSDLVTCAKVASILKRLILFESKPDIILTLISNRYYIDFFTCMKYLKENRRLSVNLELLVGSQVSFNNIIGIDNRDIVQNIHNNFRLTLIKDFLFPTSFTESQINEMNSFLMLHNNAVLSYVLKIVREDSQKFFQLLCQQTDSFCDFINELLCLLKYSFIEMKTNFSNTLLETGFIYSLLQLVLTSVKESRVRNGDEDESRKRFKLIKVSMDIISFVCKSNTKIAERILSYELKDSGRLSLTSIIPDLLEYHSKEIPEQISDIFQIHALVKLEQCDQSFQTYIAKKLIPNLKIKLDFIDDYCSSTQLFYLEFVLNIYLSLFSLKLVIFNDSLYLSNIVNDSCKVLKETKGVIHKTLLVSFLQYCRLVLLYDKDQKMCYRYLFSFIWKIFLKNLKRTNIMQALCISIFIVVLESTNTFLLKSFVKIIKKYKEVVNGYQILKDINERYYQMKANDKDLDLQLTSESESNMTFHTHSHSRVTIQDYLADDDIETPVSFLNDPSSISKIGKNNELAPQSETLPLLPKFQSKLLVIEDDFEIMNKSRIASTESAQKKEKIEININLSELGKREFIN